MNLSRLIVDLLVLNPEVSVPGLGKFSVKYIAAEIPEGSNKLVPPSCKLYFSAEYDPDDNSLLEQILKEYELEPGAAIDSITQWVSKVNEAIRVTGRFEIEGLGTIQKQDRTLNLIPDKTSIIFANSFGLEPVKIPLMEIEENTTLNKSTSQVKYGSAKTKKTLFVKIGIAAGILIIIASAIYILVDSGALKGAFDNISAIFKEKPENLNALKDSTEADSLKRKALLYEEALADSIEQANTAYQGKIAYFIVAGSFKSAQNAQKQINSLMGKGYKAEMINLGDTLYRVSIGTYYDRRKAVEEYIAITNQDPELKIWMFSRLR